jgi:acetyltransferase
MLQRSMSFSRLASAGKFDPERLFRPRSIVVIGGGRLSEVVRANLADFTGPLQHIQPGETPETADLAVFTTENEPLTPALAGLAQNGIFAAISLGQAPDIAAGLAATGVHVLGPSSFGVACPALSVNATLSHLKPPPGRVALVSQSAALCRAVLDWAQPHGVGFSQVVGIGGNAGTGFAAVLDFLSHDSATGPILLDIRRVRNRRAFLSAARAAARLRPVVAIRAGGRLIDPTGRADAVFHAALTRAGVLTVTRLEDMLAALETLTRAPPARGEGLAIVTNAVGPGQMAADAALSTGVALARLAPETRDVLHLAFPGSDARNIVYVGVEAPTRLAEAAALLGGAREVGGILVVLAPTGQADAAGIAALAAAPRGKVPLLVCAMGETTGAVHRRVLAEAGLPAFASPEQAVQGFRHLLGDRRARAAARELPASDVLDLLPDRAGLHRIIAAVRADQRLVLNPAEVGAILAAYGIDPDPALPLSLADDPLFGPAIGLGGGPVADQAFDLPPLNLSLAGALVAHARVARGLDPAAAEALADTLVRLSQLAVDCPELAALTLHPSSASLRPPGQLGELAIAPYPEKLTERFDAKGQTVIIRPIRPEDAAGHAGFFARLTPEDIRYRFFSALRELSPERIARMTQVDYDREMAFVAVNAEGDTVGVARLVCDGDVGEFAVVVQSSMKARGLARRLMERLIAWGRQQHMVTITGQVLSENAPMLGFVRRLGFTLRRLPDEPDVVEARMDLSPPTA